MNRKVFVYFLVSFAVIGSASAYFISKEAPKNNVIITGEYDIWATETTTGEEMPGTENADETVQSAMMQAETQFVYININTASAEEFTLLDDIGYATAQKIVEYRNNAGYFNNIEEILNVNGIGEKTFLKIKDHIYVENPVYQETVPTYSETVISENNATYMKLDLNKVTEEDLETVPGISHELAENIIELRTSIQYFSHPYELLYAEGMTEKLLASIIDFFYV